MTARAIPNPRPKDDATFLTEGQPVTCRCVAVEVNQANNGADVFRLLLVAEPGEKDKDGADVGGKEIVTDKYLSDNAFEYTLDTLKILGSGTAEELQAAIKCGDEARKGVLVTKLLGEIAGPFEASGLGKHPVRVTTKDEVFAPKKGPSITTRKVGYINPVPKKADADKLRTLGSSLLANIGSKPRNTPAGTPGAPAGTSAPPAVTQGPGQGGDDPIPF